VLASAATVALVRFFVQGFLSSRLTSIALVNMDDALLVVPILLGVGVVLAAVSANFAISRYLRI
jgi:cell division transport system permease protein